MRDDVAILLLSAGLGKRLQPLTANLPKPLVVVHGKTLIERNLEMIARAGFRRVFINLFYLGEQIEQFVGSGQRWGLSVEYVWEKELLDTGGAIRNVFPKAGGRTLLCINADIILGEDFRLEDVLLAHESNPAKPLATLVLRADAESRAYGEISLDSSGRVVEFLDQVLPGATAGKALMYLGVQAIDVGILSYMPEVGSIFSITRDIYRVIIQNSAYLAGIVYAGYWSDVGTPERLERASKDLARIFSVPKN